MLLVFVVETKETNDSDKMYVNKYLVSKFPSVRTTSEIVVNWVYMNGKANYNKKAVENKINDLKTRYVKYHPESKDVHVVYCIDIDDVNDRDCVRLNVEIQEYCKNKRYHLVWFNATIEHVFLGRIVHQAKNKKKEAKEFIKKQLSAEKCCDSRFNTPLFSETGTAKSNIGCVLSQLLE